jgi:xanthine dehydrogenase molybdopterin-binding subunit B
MISVLFYFQAAQVCAYELGIPVDVIKVKATNTLTAAGSCFTGSSVTSELVAKVCLLHHCNKV